MTLRKGYITGLYRQVCSEVNTRMNICFAVPKPISSYQYFRSSLSPNEVRQNRFYESKQPVDSCRKCWDRVGPPAVRGSRAHQISRSHYPDWHRHIPSDLWLLMMEYLTSASSDFHRIVTLPRLPTRNPATPLHMRRSRMSTPSIQAVSILALSTVSLHGR